MKKALFGILVIVVLGLIGFSLIGKAPEDIERAEVNDVSEDISSEEAVIEVNFEEYDLANLNFTFTGYGPGKSHDGTFKNISVRNVEQDGNKIKGGEIVFDVTSTETDTAILDGADGHLCRENFFNCENHKEIVFKFNRAEKVSDSEIKVIGNLTFKGVTKEISFPVQISEENEYSADFVVDVESFGFTAPGIVDKEVRIRFNSQM